MMGWISSLGIGTYYATYFVVYLAGLCLAWAALARVRTWLWPNLHITLKGIIVLLAIRLALFDNPAVLRFYQWTLDAPTIGLRQWGVLDLEASKYRRHIHQPRLENLAVG